MAHHFGTLFRSYCAILALCFWAVYCANTAHAIDAGMPNPPSSPTEVKLGIFLADIVDMDEVD